MTRRVGPLGVAVVVTVLIGLAGCGVPTRSTADRADPDDVPFGLLGPQEPDSSATGPGSGTTVDVYSYGANDRRLVRMAVEVDDTGLATILGQLQLPAGESGLPAGNPLDSAEVIRGVEVSRGRAVVDLADEFNEIPGSAQLIALAEIVYTATGRPGVGQVTFTLDGVPIEVPRADGSLTSDPVTRSDYARFDPDPDQ